MADAQTDQNEAAALAMIEQSMTDTLALIGKNAKPYNGGAIAIRGGGEAIRQAITQQLREMGVVGYGAYGNFLNMSTWTAGSHSIVLQQMHPNKPFGELKDTRSYVASLVPENPPQILKLTSASSVPDWPPEVNNLYNFPPVTDTYHRRLVSVGDHSLIISREPLMMTVVEMKSRNQFTADVASAIGRLHQSIIQAGGTIDDVGDDNIGLRCDAQGNLLRDEHNHPIAKVLDVGSVKWPQRATEHNPALQSTIAQGPAAHLGHAGDRPAIDNSPATPIRN